MQIDQSILPSRKQEDEVTQEENQDGLALEISSDSLATDNHHHHHASAVESKTSAKRKEEEEYEGLVFELGLGDPPAAATVIDLIESKGESEIDDGHVQNEITSPLKRQDDGYGDSANDAYEGFMMQEEAKNETGVAALYHSSEPEDQKNEQKAQPAIDVKEDLKNIYDGSSLVEKRILAHSKKNSEVIFINPNKNKFSAPRLS